jgi:hypothetical protein
VQFIEDNWGLTRIGNESADSAAGTLMNAFDFSPGRTLAPAIILNDTTGEVEKVIPSGTSAAATPAPAVVAPTSSTTATTTSALPTPVSTPGTTPSISTGKTSTSADTSVKLPKVTCHQVTKGHTVTVVCSRTGNSSALSMVRVRLYHSGKLVRNVASQVKAHGARLALHVGGAGKYTIRVTVDVAGKVSAISRNVRIG